MFDNLALAYTILDAAKASGLGRSTIYELIGDGKLDARKVAGRTLILVDSLRAFIENSPKAVIRAHKNTA